MGLPITASRKPWVPCYPACFSLCRLVTNAGRLCPQPVNLHLQEEWVGARPPGSSETTSEKKTSSPQRPPHHVHRPEKGGEKGHVHVFFTDLPLHRDWRVEVICPPSPPWSDKMVGLLLLLLSSISESHCSVIRLSWGPVDHSATNSNHKRKISEKQELSSINCWSDEYSKQYI